MRRILPWIAVGLVLCLAAPAFSQSILVWDKDHNKLFPDPEGAGNVDATYSVKKTLNNLGYTHTVTYSLPADLSPYDIIFVIMGVYC